MIPCSEKYGTTNTGLCARNIIMANDVSTMWWVCLCVGIITFYCKHFHCQCNGAMHWRPLDSAVSHQSRKACAEMQSATNRTNHHQKHKLYIVASWRVVCDLSDVSVYNRKLLNSMWFALLLHRNDNYDTWAMNLTTLMTCVHLVQNPTRPGNQFTRETKTFRCHHKTTSFEYLIPCHAKHILKQWRDTEFLRL